MSDSRESFNLLNVAGGVLMVVGFFFALFIFARYFFWYWRLIAPRYAMAGHFLVACGMLLAASALPAQSKNVEDLAAASCWSCRAKLPIRPSRKQ